MRYDIIRYNKLLDINALGPLYIYIYTLLCERKLLAIQATNQPSQQTVDKHPIYCTYFYTHFITILPQKNHIHVLLDYNNGAFNKCLIKKYETVLLPLSLSLSFIKSYILQNRLLTLHFLIYYQQYV